MKRKLQCVILTVIVVFTTVTCIDPVFFAISQEVEPRDPIVKGSPVNILVFSNALYTASGKNVYRYKKATKWEKIIDQPNKGIITHLAVSGTSLYALYKSDNKKELEIWSFDGTDWNELDKNSKFCSMYGNGGAIFVGVYDGSYKIFFIDENDNGKIKYLRDGELCGAAVNGTTNYFITKGNGAFYSGNPNSGASLIQGSEGKNFTGIINYNGKIFSITRNGSLYELSNTAATDKGISFSNNHLSTGALAIYETNDSNTPALLLVGRQNTLNSTSDTSVYYGYLELELDSAGPKAGASFKEPGTQPSSVDNSDRFQSTLGKQPVNHILQPPSSIDNTEKLLFACTQSKGLWSYRNRNGTWQWNAED